MAFFTHPAHTFLVQGWLCSARTLLIPVSEGACVAGHRKEDLPPLEAGKGGFPGEGRVDFSQARGREGSRGIPPD